MREARWPIVPGLDIDLFLARLLGTGTPEVLTNGDFQTGLTGWTIALTSNGATLVQGTTAYDIDGPGPLGTSLVGRFAVGRAGVGDPGGIELTQNIQLNTGTPISFDLSIDNSTGFNNASGGVFDLIVDGASLANHTTGDILQGEVAFDSLAAVYNGPSGLHDVGVRIVRFFNATFPPFQLIDNFTVGSATPIFTLDQICAADVADTPDCAVGLDDLPNFVTCLLQAGCP